MNFYFLMHHQSLALKFQSIFLLLITSSLSSQIIFQQNFQLNSNDLFSLIQIKQSDLIANASFNSTNYLEINVQLSMKSSNGSFLIDDVETANTVVKLWKNFTQQQKNHIFSLTYENLTERKQFSQKIDLNDNGQVDLQALYQMKSTHTFLIGNQDNIEFSQSNQTLFVLGIYRFNEQNLPILNDLFPNKNWSLSQLASQQLSIQVSIYQIKQYSECKSCQMNLTYCPLKNCKCYNSGYQNCHLQRLQIKQLDTTQNNFLWTQSQHFNYYQNEINSTQEVAIQFSTNLQMPILILLQTQPLNNPLSQASLYNYEEIYSFSLNSFMNTAGSSFSRLLTQQKNQQLKSITIRIPPLSYLYISVFTYQIGDMSTIFMLSIKLNKAYNDSNNVVINIFLIMIAVFCFLFLILVIVCLCRYCIVRNSSSNNNQRKVLNIDYENLKNIDFPSVYYAFLQQFIFSNKKLKIQDSDGVTANIDTFQEQGLECINIPESCSICLQDFEQSSIVKYTYCGHILHEKCVKLWFKKQFSCPLCRQIFSFQEIAEYQKKLKLKVVNSKDILIRNLFQMSNINIQSRIVQKMIGKPAMNHEQQNLDVSLTQQQFQNTIKGKVQARIISNFYNQNNLQMLQADSFTDLNSRKVQNKLNKMNRQSKLKTIGFQTGKQQIQPITMDKLSRVYKFYKIIYLYHELSKHKKSDQLIFQLKSSNSSQKKQSVNRMFGVASSKTPIKENQLQQNKDSHVQELINSNLSPSDSKDYDKKFSEKNIKTKNHKLKGFSSDLNELEVQLNLRSNPNILQKQMKIKQSEKQFIRIEDNNKQNDIIILKTQPQTSHRKDNQNSQFVNDNQPIINDLKGFYKKQHKQHNQNIFENQEPLVFSQYQSREGSYPQTNIDHNFKQTENQFDQNGDQTRSIQENKVYANEALRLNKMSVPLLKYPQSKIKSQNKNSKLSKRKINKRKRADPILVVQQYE